MKISVNGSICEEQEAVISVYDHGFLYGLGLFETFRTYNGKPFLLQKHLARLADGCRMLGIEYTPDEQRIRELLDQLLQKNNLQDAYFRYTISAGIDILGLPISNYQHANEIVYIKPLPQKDNSAYILGKSLQLLKLPRNTPEGPYRLKSIHYMNNILAKRELQSYVWASGAEGLMLSKDGYVAEGIVSNVFFVKNGIHYTPSLNAGILPGITRSFILSLTEGNQFVVKEGLFRWEALLAADEIYFVNSIQEVVPVTQLFTPDGRNYRVGTGLPGDSTHRLMRIYKESAGSGL